MPHVVGEEDGGGATGRVADDRERRVAVVEAEPTPLRRMHGVPDEPGDQEVVGDDQFVPVLFAVHRPGEQIQRPAGRRRSVLPLLIGGISEEAEMEVR